jgi:type II secretory ATPase GspE/PulE/Tfp pilus assembly ATPase PilB-like protein
MKCKWRSCSNEVTSQRKIAAYCSFKCKNKQAVQRRREKLKHMAILYKGNKCHDCHTQFKEYTVYEFHHLDPAQKDFSLSCDGHTRSWETIKSELDKCAMLCANCHRIRHFQELKPVYKELLELVGPVGNDPTT